MITAWRIVTARHAAFAFDGEGASEQGGRWNSPGLPVVYAAQSASLAALEMLVHIGRGALLAEYVLIPCTLAEALVSRLDRQRLPDNWKSYPAPPELQWLGDEWIKGRASAVLEVPSAIIETESNYLLNPDHRDFQSIRILKAKPFTFDLRVLKP